MRHMRVYGSSLDVSSKGACILLPAPTSRDSAMSCRAVVMVSPVSCAQHDTYRQLWKSNASVFNSQQQRSRTFVARHAAQKLSTQVSPAKPGTDPVSIPF